ISVLLVPPLRLMSAVMWKVIRLRNIQHYGKVEEFVSLVTEVSHPPCLEQTMSQRSLFLLTDS
uniref:TERF1-interacting nuclear factor 2 N-terminal domain-containing protein n=1 Tax=Mola mola TaxID=94237 RepID=A0A3Q4BF87_MOLML